MLISIIVPVYNVENYLKQCIDSILNQTYKNIEIILVNDGSTDNSGKICDMYENNYNNIKVIHKANEGLGTARNSGMKIMTGEYVTFVDSDDYIDTHLIENFYKIISKTKADMCKSGFRRVNDNGKIYQNRVYREEYFFGQNVKNFLLPRLIGSLPNKKDSIEMCVCASIYNTKNIKEHNIEFPSERVLISEDLIFNIEYIKHAESAIIMNYIGYNYRYNPNSLTKQYRENRFQLCKDFYSYIKKCFLKQNLENEINLRISRMFFIYLRMCISQENPKVSNKTKQDALNSLKKICQDKEVQAIIDQYPINQIGFKQKIFLKTIKYKRIKLLFLFMKLRII